MATGVIVYFFESVQTGDLLRIRADEANVWAVRLAQDKPYNGIAMNNFQVGDSGLWVPETGKVDRYAS